MKEKSEHCPRCNYPEKCFGIYVPGGKCPECGFVDIEKAIDGLAKQMASDLRNKLYKCYNAKKMGKEYNLKTEILKDVDDIKGKIDRLITATINI